MKVVYKDLSGKEYTKSSFIQYIERKIMRTIRQHNMLEKDDVIVTAMSGGKDSMTVAYVLNQILSKRGQTLTALLIDEGIPGYRDETIEDAKKFCKDEGIKLVIVETHKEFGFNLTQALKKLKAKPCTICGAMRRYLLNKHARKLGATKVVTGHNLDDEAQTVFMNQCKGNVRLSAKLGPMTGVKDDKKFIRRIKPLYFITEKEVTIYATLKQFPVKFTECPNARNAFRAQIRTTLNNLEQQYPGTKHSILQGFLDILPQLRSTVEKDTIEHCSTCEEPSKKDPCSMCEIISEYNKK